MLPERLSTDLTSLNENADRMAVVVEIVVSGDGSISSTAIYRALVRNQAQLTYNGVGPWLEGTAAPPPRWLRPPRWRYSSSCRMKLLRFCSGNGIGWEH